jgi:hypothetical protein
MQWPRNGDAADVFVAQIDLAELPFRPDGFPEDGMLYIFLGYDETKVYFATKERELARIRPPEPFRHKNAYREVPLYLSESIPAGLDRLPMSRLSGVTFTDYHAEELQYNYSKVPGEEIERFYQVYQKELEAAYRAAGLPHRIDRIGFYADEAQGSKRSAYSREGGENDQGWNDWPRVWGCIEGALRYSQEGLGSRRSADHAEPSVARTFHHLAQWLDRAITRGWDTPMTQEDHKEFMRWLREDYAFHLRESLARRPGQGQIANNPYAGHNRAVSALRYDDGWHWAIARLLLDDPEKAHLIEQTKQAEIIGPAGIYARMFGFGSPHVNYGNEWRDHLLLFEFSGWMQPFGFLADNVKTWTKKHALVPNEWQDTVSVFEST